ncbi:MAG TPA: NlpC/P60 family protein [Actinomycetes bacterium]|nr:NlpC/P60 family protein [Actinomycetes bacterium]
MATRRFSRAVVLTLAATLSVSAIALVPGTGSAAPNPTIEQVQAQVDRLYRDAEAATERAHEATVKVAEARDRLKRLQKQIAIQQKDFDVLQETITGYAVQMYSTGGIDPTLQMMLSSDPDHFLAQAQSLDQVMRTQDSDLRRVEVARLALAQSQDVADQELTRLKDLQAEAAKEKAAANAKLDQAQELLSRLKQKERERLAALQAQRQAAADAASRDAMRNVPAPPPTTSSGSGRGSSAVAYAQAQLGKPYVFGGAGPDVFDCSGLTMAAWAQAGVSLPHAVSLQYAATARVDSGSLQPGDLVFFYSGLDHVGIYVGGGTFIHAANPTDGVVADDLFSSYWQSVYMGAGRV